ncbi:MAG TPA: glycoside hydrolase family 6 protein [Polyangiaceae bacterium]|nr:glycoside hydrolase family 6 protein [Polyangiaceae bacterium]
MSPTGLTRLSVTLALVAGCGGASAPAPAAPTGPGATASTAAPAAASTAAAGAPSSGGAATPAAAPAAPVISKVDLEAASKVPPRVKGKSPFAGVRLYVNEYSQAAIALQNLRASRPDDAKLIEKIAAQPTAQWVGEWSGDPETTVHNFGKATNANGTVPVLVAYNVPNRDCGQYSAGGSKSAEAYHQWIRDFARGAGPFRIIVVLEPDALPQLTKCLSPADQQARLDMIKDAINVLEATPGVSVYLDAGHAKWVPAAEMAKRLIAAGVENADGFSLNVSNYVTTEENIAYGHAISKAIGGKHFIIDTSRNGNGPTADAQWCNPEGRALGNAPTTSTGDPLVDAFFWVKPPGESDGTCNGGPKAGEFWPEAAAGMAKRAKW